MKKSELASRAGLAPSFITELEAKKKAPGSKSLRSLAAALDVDPRALDPNETPREFPGGRKVSVSIAAQILGMTADEVRRLVARRELMPVDGSTATGKHLRIEIRELLRYELARG